MDEILIDLTVTPVSWASSPEFDVAYLSTFFDTPNPAVLCTVSFSSGKEKEMAKSNQYCMPK